MEPLKKLGFSKRLENAGSKLKKITGGKNGTIRLP